MGTVNLARAIVDVPPRLSGPSRWVHEAKVQLERACTSGTPEAVRAAQAALREAIAAAEQVEES